MYYRPRFRAQNNNNNNDKRKEKNLILDNALGAHKNHVHLLHNVSHGAVDNDRHNDTLLLQQLCRLVSARVGTAFRDVDARALVFLERDIEQKLCDDIASMSLSESRRRRA